jgi:hypothetical protein
MSGGSKLPICNEQNGRREWPGAGGPQVAAQSGGFPAGIRVIVQCRPPGAKASVASVREL